jgi:cell division protein ZapE
MRTAQPLKDRYLAVLAQHGFEPDAAQLAAVARLEDLRHRLVARQSGPGFSLGLLAALRRTRERAPERGIYLWGGVGRGKTFLLDLFFQELPLERKRRAHFHRFMQGVHAGLRDLREVESPLAEVARRIAEEATVLCFDELFVSDIADAMILGGLFDALFREGVTLVATSNVAPSGLYRDGLQRQRFLPAIALLEQRTEVLEMDAGTDYRLRQLERARIYLGPEEADPDTVLAREFELIADGPGEADAVLTIEGRPVRTRRLGDEVVWFDFEALCAGPRGAADYIELARSYHTVLLSGVPVMDATSDDQARRFVTLVDEFYDRGVKLILAAAATPRELYRGERLAFEFRRTSSRLTEMQSREYLARPHLA